MHTVNPEILARILFSRMGLKDNSRLWHDLPISVNDRIISPFLEDFRENKTLAKISGFTV